MRAPIAREHMTLAWIAGAADIASSANEGKTGREVGSLASSDQQQWHHGCKVSHFKPDYCRDSNFRSEGSEEE